MKLYGYYRSSATYRLRIILNAKGLDWDYQAVNLPVSDFAGYPLPGRTFWISLTGSTLDPKPKPKPKSLSANPTPPSGE